MTKSLFVTVTICLMLAAAACSADGLPTEPLPTTASDATASTAMTNEGGDEVAFQLTSTAYSEGDAVPVRYTCDGEDISPPLAWAGVPEGTVTFALIFDDPDSVGGTWDHWILFDIPAQTRSLAEAQPAGDELPGGGRHGANSWGRREYGGPCPPRGTHRYIFTLYALDTALELPPGASRALLLGAMQGHILDQTELNGTYSR